MKQKQDKPIQTIKAWAIIDERGKIDDGTGRYDIYKSKRKAKKDKQWWGEKEDKVIPIKLKY